MVQRASLLLISESKAGQRAKELLVLPGLLFCLGPLVRSLAGAYVPVGCARTVAGADVCLGRQRGSVRRTKNARKHSVRKSTRRQMA